MKTLLILIITLSNLLVAAEPIHSSASLYFESKTFTSSVQKLDAKVYGVAADIHHNDSEYKFAYESGSTNTIQPPLPKDLHTDKLFLKYAYTFDDTFTMNVNYIDILHDNLAITDEGKAYGLGVTYKQGKKLQANFTQYITKYDDFEVLQSDLKIDVKFKIKDMRIKLSSLSKYISIDDINTNSFTKNAKRDYFTSGIKLHSHYKTYHLGAGAYFGKRAFAIMDDGFKIQHHAMEFDRTYALGVGKDFGPLVFRIQYVYQRATELPSSNANVEIGNIRLITNYRF